MMDDDAFILSLSLSPPCPSPVSFSLARLINTQQLTPLHHHQTTDPLTYGEEVVVKGSIRLC